MQVLLRGNVVEERSSDKRLPPDDGHESKEILNDQQPDGDHTGNDLAGSQRGGETAHSGKGRAHQHNDGKSPDQVAGRPGWRKVSDPHEHFKLHQRRNPKCRVKNHCREILGKHDLPSPHWGREQSFQSAGPLLFREKPHRDQRKDKKEIEPEKRRVKSHINQTVFYWRIAKPLHRRGQRNALHDRDECENHPAERGEEIPFEFFKSQNTEQSHDEGEGLW